VVFHVLRQSLYFKSAALDLATSWTLVTFIFILGYLFISWVSNAFLLDVTGINTFLPVHIHYIPDRNSLSILFFMIWNILLSSKLFIACRSYVQSSSPFLPNHISAFLVWFSQLHFILYARIPRCLYPVLFLIVSIFLSDIFSLIFSNLLFRTSSLHLSVTWHFNKPSSLIAEAHVAWQLLKLIFTACCMNCNPSDLNRVEDISLKEVELVYFKIILYITLFCI
jgi:hypothetical protein